MRFHSVVVITCIVRGHSRRISLIMSVFMHVSSRCSLGNNLMVIFVYFAPYCESRQEIRARELDLMKPMENEAHVAADV